MDRVRTNSLLPVAAAALLCALLPLALSRALPWRDAPSIAGAADPLQQAAILQWTLHHLPLRAAAWDAPWLWPAPHALAGMDPLLTQAVLVRWLPGARANAAWAYNAAVSLTLALSFVGTWWLARRLQLGRAAAWLAGAVYATGPYAASHAMHLNQLPQPWLPLALLALLELARAGRDRRAGGVWAAAALLTGALVAQLASGVYLTAATCVAVAVVTLALAPTLRGRTWLALGAALAIVAGALWAYSRPYATAAAELPGFVRTAQQVGPFAARPFDLLHPPVCHLLPWPRALVARPSLYPGWLWSLLALAGIAALWRTRPRGAVERSWLAGLVVAAAVATVLTFGRSMPMPGLGEVRMPFAWLQDAVWPLRAIRAPSRFFVVAALALALCGAAGAEWLLRRVWRAQARPLAVAAVLLALLELAPGPLQRLRVQPDAQERTLLAAMQAQPEASVWVAFPQPCDEPGEDELDARCMLWALWAQQPVAGGASGFVPVEVADLRTACCKGPTEDCLAYLERSGIRMALVPRGDPLAGVQLPRVVTTDAWELVVFPSED